MLRLRIHEVAREKGMKQGQLQVKSGVTPQLLQRYWHNHTLSAAFEPLEKIARALDVPVGELFEQTTDTGEQLCLENASSDE